ncbi:MAG: lysophospholipid acyltransferase family protein [Candidatus Omnitrophota bacterium]
MFNYIYYKIGIFLANKLPLKGAYALARFISDIHFIYSKADRVAVLNNLRVILPNRKNHLGIAINVFRNFSIYLVDFFRTPKFDKAMLKDKVDVVGLEYVDEALKKGKGIIAGSAHLCNWELGGLIMGLLGYPVSVVAFPHRNKRINDYFNYQRQSKGVGVIPVGKAARKCIESFKNNEIIGLVGDREFTEHGMVIDFFGKKTLIPKGLATLSLLTGAPIIMGLVIRGKDNNFKFIWEKPIEPVSTGDKEKDIHDLTRKYLEVIERYIRKYPDQWLMFRKFWI